MRAFVWVLAGAVRAAPLASGVWLAESVLSGLLVPAQLWLTKALVDSLAAQLQGRTDLQTGLWLFLLAAVVVAERVLQGSEGLLAAEVRERAGAQVREAVMRRAAVLPAAAFEDQTYYDRLSRVMGDAEQRVPTSVFHTMTLIRRVPQLLGYGAGLFAVSPVLLLVVVVGWAPSVAIFSLAGKSHFSLLREQTPRRRLSEFYDGYLRWRTSAKEVRLYGLRDYFLNKWEAIYWETRDAQRALAFRMGLRQQGVVMLSEAVSVFGLLAIVMAGIGRGTAGDYAVLFQSLFGMVQTMFGLASTTKILAELSEYARDYRGFMALETESDVLRKGGDVVSKINEAVSAAAKPFPRPLVEGIRFEDVWFTYPGSERPVLCGVSYHIRPGEKVALVGENGAGKSTLVKLLLGLFRPDAGKITFDGIDASEIDLSAQRRAMSAVFQAFTHYHLTLAENVGVGEPAMLGDRERVRAAAVRAAVDEFASGLAQGYDTLLGPEAGGTDLSGGQWQRVAAARAFFRDADVLVLDEPTAALDPLAELAVFERFVELAEGKTAVLISHRLGMARLADRVLVLREGKLLEDGAHAALVKAGGEYAALFGAQARWYA